MDGRGKKNAQGIWRLARRGGCGTQHKRAVARNGGKERYNFPRPSGALNLGNTATRRDGGVLAEAVAACYTKMTGKQGLW